MPLVRDKIQKSIPVWTWEPPAAWELPWTCSRVFIPEVAFHRIWWNPNFVTISWLVVADCFLCSIKDCESTNFLTWKYLIPRIYGVASGFLKKTSKNCDEQTVLRPLFRWLLRDKRWTFYQDTKRHGWILNVYFQVKEVKLKMLHTVWFQLEYDILEKVKL